ncbi:MAG: hypothetical protein KAT05_14615 [Spirochaetes bacterium]|nr:hypothetical protein [Spirochaetota bacterium]
MKVIISDFIDKKPDFSNFSQIDQVKYLAYFHIKSTDDEIFTSENIRLCFELARLPKPQNISSVFNKLKKKNTFIQSKNGYVFHRDVIKELDEEFSSENEKEISDDKFEWIFNKGEHYDIYKIIRDIVKKAETEVLIVDGYPSDKIYNLYLDEIPKGVEIKLLTNRPQGNFIDVTQLWIKNPDNKLEIKKGDIHDRLIFVDNECWILGASIKDAGNKPTYLVKITNKEKMFSIYSEIFDKGKTYPIT